MQILIIEDDRRLADVLEKGLKDEGHRAFVAGDGKAGFEIARTTEFDVIVLDIMLPGMDGLSVARGLRGSNIRTPILMLTARDKTSDIVEALDLGADDYLTKPFSFEVLLARLRALARRGPVERPVQLQVGDLSLDPGSHEVFRGERKLSLTRTEYRLLEVLMRRPGQVVARDALIAAVWGFDTDIESNTLEAFIKSLRQKVDAASETKLIHTVRGVGYVVRETLE